jgi:nicotinamide-nucleotide amidase
MNTAQEADLALSDVVTQLATALSARGWCMATAESCTGGLIAAGCTAQAGSSGWFERGWVTYSNAAKQADLGVPADLLAAHGAVSEAVARAMADGAAHRAGVAASVAVTGIAGPGGGSADKPVGTVWLAWHVAGTTHAQRHHLGGDRTAVRATTTQLALAGLLDRVLARSA